MSNLNLMVGDWVQCKGKNICLTAGHLYEVSLDIHKASPYQPIPLTLDILKKIEGMEKIHALQYRLGNRLFVIRDGIIVDYASDLPLPNLHTLQQLIRLFTNKEIEIEW